MEKREFNEYIAPIGGWLTYREGSFLYDLAKGLSERCCVVEIGSWKGRSTSCLGLGAKHGNHCKIYAVDPHTGSSEHKRMFGPGIDTYQEFLDNIEKNGVGDYIEPIRETSEGFAKRFNKKINAIFIDGEHKYGFAKKDYTRWFPKVRNGGVIMFHDAWLHQLGVFFFTSFLLLSSTQLKSPRLIDTCLVVEKIEKNGFIDRIKNILFVIIRPFIGAIGLLRLKCFGTVLD